jgi:hypothetical protein
MQALYLLCLAFLSVAAAFSGARTLTMKASVEGLVSKVSQQKLLTKVRCYLAFCIWTPQ